MKALEKIKQGDFELSKEEIIGLLQIDTHSDQLYELLAVSNKLSRSKFGNRGYVFTQIGINAEPCPVNCKFCSMASSHYSLGSQWEKTPDEICIQLTFLQQSYFDDFFLMTTADYPQDKIISIGKTVKSLLRENQKLVANIGDFSLKTALLLKEAGFTGAYHITAFAKE